MGIRLFAIMIGLLTFCQAAGLAYGQTVKKIRIGYPSLSFRQSNDLTFLQELEKEGFFNEMAKRYPTK